MKTLKDLSEEMLFSNAMRVSLDGWQFRKGFGAAHIRNAVSKSLKTPPFKTECHIDCLEGYLAGILKKVKKVSE